MAYALVAHTGLSSSDTNNVTTAAINTTGASLLVIVLSSYGDGPDTTVSDSINSVPTGNTWTPLTAVDSGGAIRLVLFYCQNPTVGALHTFSTVNASPPYPTLNVAAFSGAKTTGVFDQQNGAYDTSLGVSTLQPGSVTPTEDNELIVTGIFTAPGEIATTTIVGGGGFTITDKSGIGGTSFAGGMAYLIQTTATATNPTWTLPGNNYLGVKIATFKAAAVVGDTTPPVLSAGSPSGTLAAGTTSTTLSVTTDEAATCKWGIVASTAYASIANTFSTTGGTSHSTTMSGLADGTSYTVYVRAQDSAGNPTLSDYTITFSVDEEEPESGTVTFTDLVNLRDELMRADSRVTVMLANPGATSSSTAATYLVKDPDPGDTATVSATGQANAKGGQSGGRNLAWKEYSYDDLATAYGLAGVPGGGDGDAEITIAAETWRWDGNSGAVLVSSGFPHQPGEVTAENLAEYRVYVGAPLVEQAVALHPLDGPFPDGSYRSIGIQYNYTLTHDTPVPAEIRINQGVRGTTDLTWTEPTKAIVMKKAVIAPTSPAYLCGTMVTLTPLTPATNDTGINATWAAYGESSFLDPLVGLDGAASQGGGAVYEHAMGCMNIWCRTGNRVFYQWGYDWATAMLDSTSISGGLGPGFDPRATHTLLPYLLPPTASFGTCTGNSTYNPEGLDGSNACGDMAENLSLRILSHAPAYWLTAWRQFKRNVAHHAQYALSSSNTSYAAQRDWWLTYTYGHRFNFGKRGIWTAMVGYLMGVTTGFDIYSTVGVNTWDYATYLPWILDALEEYVWNLPGDYRNGLVGQRHTTISVPDGPGHEGTGDHWGITNFQLTITAESLMFFYDHILPSSRVPPLIKFICDYLITQIKPAQTGDSRQDIGVLYVGSYDNLPPATVATPTFSGTTSISSTTVTWVSGNIPPEYFQPGHTFVGTGIPAGAYVTAVPVGNAIIISAAATANGTNTFRVLMNPYDLVMYAPVFAWYYAYSGTALYDTWAGRCLDTNAIAMASIKNWGESYGGTRQGLLYYRAGGTIRGTAGVHPTVITNPPLQPLLG